MIGSSQGKQEVDPFMGVVWVPNLGLSVPLILFAVTLFPLNSGMIGSSQNKQEVDPFMGVVSQTMD